MLSIRLTRTGKTHAPHYRIVVQEARSKLNGRAIDTIGHYHPAQASKLLVIDHEKATAWMQKGAQPSDTVTNLFVKEGILEESRKIKHFYTAAPKAEEVKETPKKEEVVEEAPTEETSVEETSVEEAPAEEVPNEEVAPEEVAETEEAAA